MSAPPSAWLLPRVPQSFSLTCRVLLGCLLGALWPLFKLDVADSLLIFILQAFYLSCLFISSVCTNRIINVISGRIKIFVFSLKISVPFSTAFGADTEGSQWIVGYLLQKVLSNLSVCSSEQGLADDTVQLLVTTSTGSLASQRHPGKFPKVPGRRRGPTRLPRPWDSPGKNAGVGCHFLLQSLASPRDEA